MPQASFGIGSLRNRGRGFGDRRDNVGIAGAATDIAGETTADLGVRSRPDRGRIRSQPVISIAGVQKPHCSA